MEQDAMENVVAASTSASPPSRADPKGKSALFSPSTIATTPPGRENRRTAAAINCSTKPGDMINLGSAFWLDERRGLGRRATPACDRFHAIPADSAAPFVLSRRPSPRRRAVIRAGLQAGTP
ncbi:MAG: hypothetical protein WDM81_18020, partial [Rhizomicrobium sp.]